MTNKEAANELKCYHWEDGTVPEEIILAIKALEKCAKNAQGDLISRSALKEEFAKHEDRKGYLIGDWEEIIDNALTVERPKGEWIPVRERLPDEKLFISPSSSDFCFDFEEVLCTTIWGDVRAYKFGKPIGHDKPHFWLGGGIMDEYIIAWQYKPEPYKEVEE